MTDWPKYNAEWHATSQAAYREFKKWTAICARCHVQCSLEHPCRCCETARADEAEAALDRVRTVRDKWHDHRSLEMFSAVCIVADLTDALDGGVSATSCAACGGSGFADYAAVPCPVCRGAE